MAKKVNKKTEEVTAKMKALQTALEKLKKSYGKGSVMRLGESTTIDVDVISTGSLGLDVALGTNGFPKGRIIEISGWESSGKAQPLYSQILTPNGYVAMGDIEVGMEVNTPCGDTTTVIGVYPQGKKKIYRLTLDDKTQTDCCEDHLWLVYTRKSGKNGKELGEVMPLKKLISNGLTNKRGVRKYKLPKVESQKMIGDLKKIDLPLDPYIMGLLLGDGSFRSTSVGISTMDNEIIDYIKNVCHTQFENLTLSEVQNQCDYRFKKRFKGREKNAISVIAEKLRLIGLYSYEKFIPEVYLKASINDRVSLLQGLMDSDGTCGINGTLSYTSTSKKLSAAFEFLCRSLGLRCTTSSRITKYTSKTGNKVDGRVSYRSFILLNGTNIIPFKLERKLHNITEKKHDFSNRFIESIDYIGEEECQCIMVGHPDSLYITDKFIPTHNTTLTIHAIAECQKAGGTAAFIDAEHAFDRYYAKNLGVDVDNLIFSQPDCGEDALEIAEGLIRSNAVDILVIDSVAALVPRAEIEGEMGQSMMGLHARLMSQAMRKLSGVISKSNCCVIFINQMREKIGVMFGNPNTTTGGNALKFYASQRLEVRRKAAPVKNKDGGASASHVIVKVIKNKLAPPFCVAEFDIEYGTGISKSGEIVDMGVELNIISKGGSWYGYGDAKIAQGRIAAKQFMLDNPEVATEIEEKIKAKLFEAQ